MCLVIGTVNDVNVFFSLLPFLSSGMKARRLTFAFQMNSSSSSTTTTRQTPTPRRAATRATATRALRKAQKGRKFYQTFVIGLSHPLYYSV